MEKSKHTPGPWTTIPGNYFVNANGRGMQSVYCAEHPNWPLVSVAGTTDTNKEEIQANARLIAAAPELLAFAEAVEGVILWAIDNGADRAAMNGLLKMRRAAIAKAEGE